VITTQILAVAVPTASPRAHSHPAAIPIAIAPTTVTGIDAKQSPSSATGPADQRALPSLHAYCPYHATTYANAAIIHDTRPAIVTHDPPTQSGPTRATAAHPTHSLAAPR
jgi:hypothetical protein